MLSSRLKSRRLELGLTQQDVAKKLNITYQTISKYERDVNLPDSTMLANLSEILECTTDYLLGKTDTPTHSVYENDEVKLHVAKSYPYELTPDEVEKVIGLLKEYRFDIDSLIKDVKEGKVT